MLGALPRAANAVANETSPLLVPEPRSIMSATGHAALSSQWEIVLVDSNAVDLDAAAALAEDVRIRFGWSWPITARPSGRSAVTIRPGRPLTPLPNPDQGYALEVRSTGIDVTGRTAQGRFYGIQTLRQLVRGTPTPRLRCVSIEDAPELAWRGVSDDVSRGQLSTIDDFEKIIAHLAYYKINLYGLYIEDVLSPNGDPANGLTLSELDRIARAAARHHITVVPILESFGNNPLVTAGYASPWFRYFPWFDRILSPRSRSGRVSPLPASSTRALLSAMNTLAARLPSPWLHIGGDEHFTFGLQDARAIAADGSTHLELAHYLTEHLATEHRRQTMVYGDLLAKPLILDRLRRDLVVVDRNYSAPKDSSIRKLHEAGFEKVFVDGGLWTWNTFYPDFDNAFHNVAAFTDSGKVRGILGAFASAWGDNNGSENLRSNNWPGYAFGAATAWGRLAPETTGFLEAFAAVEYGARAVGLAEAVQLVGWRDLGAVDHTGRAVHRMPRVQPAGTAHLVRMTNLAVQMQQALRVIDQAEARVLFNRETLGGIRLAARRFLLHADRELTMHVIAGQLGEGTIRDLPKPRHRAIVRDLERLAAINQSVVEELQRLWLQANRRGALDVNVERLRRQGEEYQALLTRAGDGTLAVWKPGQHPRSADIEVASTP